MAHPALLAVMLGLYSMAHPSLMWAVSL